jgi:phosphoenolpyruvate mutase
MNSSELRRAQLKISLQKNSLVRILEAHSGLTGLIVERSKARRGDQIVEFDGIWFSSFTNATIKGLPDNERFNFAARLQSLDDLLAVTSKPIIYDADSGGTTNHFCAMVRALEVKGVSALIVHDRAGAACNSLSDNAAIQGQMSVDAFCAKLGAALASRMSNDFMVIARIESLIRGAGIQDAIARAHAYVDAGAEGILVHSRSNNPDEVLECCRRFSRENPNVPLVVVPSTYSGVSEDELAEAGVRMVIYANQLLRSAYPAMASTANRILEAGRALEADSHCLSIGDTLRLLERDPLLGAELAKIAAESS